MSYKTVENISKMLFILKGTANHANYIITNICRFNTVTNTEIFAFLVILVFKLLSRKDLFINRKTVKK